MGRLLLGTKNEGKLREAQELLAGVDGLELLTVFELPFRDVPETEETFWGNALLKAVTIHRETGFAVLAEDAGLEVFALQGAPGVRSARFAGEPCDPVRNNEMLLDRLQGVNDRRARFITAAALCLCDGQVFVCSGVLPGRIALVPAGDMGFGYDPLFVPNGCHRTLAQLPLAQKNRISHRFKALSRMRSLIGDLLDSGEFA